MLRDFPVNEIEWVTTTDNMKVKDWAEYMDCPVYKAIRLPNGKLGIILAVI